jgi:predicted metal-dependent peptidase
MDHAAELDRTADLDPTADLDGAKLAAARLWATDKFPYLASAIFASPSLPAPGIGRVSIDRSWRIHADPEVVDGASVDELGGELVHLAAHVLRDHAGRADAVGLGETAELHHWVDAADAEIADDFPPDLSRVTEGADPATLDTPEGRLAEEYYRHGSVRDGAHVDCGSGAHGQPAIWEPPPDDDDEQRRGVARSDQDLLRRRVAADIDAAAAGEVAAGLRRWAAEQLGSRVDWRSELAASLRRAVSTVSGAVDYSYSRPSRRASTAGDVVMPSLRRPAVEVAVVCDTSASVDEDLLATAVAEVDGLLRAVGTRAVRVLACDDAVRATTRVVSVDDLVLIGGGGTDLGVGLHAAVDHRPVPHLVVVLTDGYTPWPTEAPRADVVVGMLETDQPVAPPDPPSWATVVVIDG